MLKNRHSKAISPSPFTTTSLNMYLTEYCSPCHTCILHSKTTTICFIDDCNVNFSSYFTNETKSIKTLLIGKKLLCLSWKVYFRRTCTLRPTDQPTFCMFCSVLFIYSPLQSLSLKTPSLRDCVHFSHGQYCNGAFCPFLVWLSVLCRTNTSHPLSLPHKAIHYRKTKFRLIN